ncbi:FecCD family ABC transporter permease [Vibrio tapetis]|uniref:Achromobactin transport system permease protein CbrB n=1 Tax=Vibrio tapetis subsp. tapetis TaxID=1671868 RepID=A0A2N8ZHN6_9VIBR|nr:iron ABC transporter permease [Vibrio tapetis]SON51423.1 Achromobactin transport system permease protein CbrB [Vibrio tapetis subsp. tapetis]
MLLAKENNQARWGMVVLSIFVLVLAFISSMTFGQYPISFGNVISAVFQPEPTSIEYVIITTTRLSRSLVALSVGGALAVAGTLMQSLTRNPLASPAIFGVNAGAIFFIVLLSQVFILDSPNALFWGAMIGAGVAGSLVYGLGTMGRDGASPVRIVLAGAAISALFISFTQGILVVGQEGIDSILFWIAGSVSGRELDVVIPVLPYLVVGLICALLLAPHINVLLSGDDVATGLGQNTALLKIAISVLIIGLAGTSVAMAGNIGFIGLVVPHMVRAFVGNDHKWLISISALWGGILLLFSDVIGRSLLAPEEVPIGVMTALLGAPFFVYLARQGGKSE